MDFFARMSHDMRTPMNGILGMAELSAGETDVETLHYNMSMVKESGTYMLSLINDTLDLQKIEMGKLRLEPEICNVRLLVDSIFHMVFPTAQQKGIEIQTTSKNIDLDGYILADPVRVKQILINLVSNAVKFTPKDGRIELVLERLGSENQVDRCRFMVRDSGVGMSQDFIENSLFTPYAQEHNSVTTQYAGSGLGLAITKSLVELMGGRIEVESQVSEGTTFTVFLDFKRTEAAAVLQSEESREERRREYEAALDGKRILLCEDHPLNAEIAVRLLKKVGCEAVRAENGRRGLELFAASAVGEFDGILMDIRMPEMDGLTAARAIRALERPDAKTIPILAMTANAYDEDVEQSLKAGMNAHLAKPIEPLRLYEVLGGMVRGKSR